jgi:DNA-binding FadR family transcriptional regulator
MAITKEQALRIMGWARQWKGGGTKAIQTLQMHVLDLHEIDNHPEYLEARNALSFVLATLAALEEKMQQNPESLGSLGTMLKEASEGK